MSRKRPESSLELGPEPYAFTCRNCGARIAKSEVIGMELSAFARYVSALSDVHRYCLSTELGSRPSDLGTGAS